MLRIDPARPPLWRTPTTLQFGADALVTLDDPPAWQQRLVRELERGIPDDAALPFAVALGAAPRAARAFLDRLDLVLAAPEEPARRVIVQAAGDVPHERLATIIEALAASGCDVAVAHPFDGPGVPGADAAAVIVVAQHLVPPAFASALMADDRTHLPLVLTGTGAEIGPCVRPGHTACLSCLAAARRDEDATWPTIAAQLVARPLEVVDPTVLWEAGFVAARLLSESDERPERIRSRSLILRAGSLRRIATKHRPHADCRCRSLAGSGTAAVPVHLEPTTPTAYARPA